MTQKYTCLVRRENKQGRSLFDNETRFESPCELICVLIFNKDFLVLLTLETGKDFWNYEVMRKLTNAFTIIFKYSRPLARFFHIQISN